MEMMHLAQYLANDYLYFYLLAFIHLRLNDKMAWNKENQSQYNPKVIFLFQNILVQFPTIFERLHLCKIQAAHLRNSSNLVKKASFWKKLKMMNVKLSRCANLGVQFSDAAVELI